MRLVHSQRNTELLALYVIYERVVYLTRMMHEICAYKVNDTSTFLSCYTIYNIFCPHFFKSLNALLNLVFTLIPLQYRQPHKRSSG